MSTNVDFRQIHEPEGMPAVLEQLKDISEAQSTAIISARVAVTVSPSGQLLTDILVLLKRRNASYEQNSPLFSKGKSGITLTFPWVAVTSSSPLFADIMALIASSGKIQITFPIIKIEEGSALETEIQGLNDQVKNLVETML